MPRDRRPLASEPQTLHKHGDGVKGPHPTGAPLSSNIGKGSSVGQLNGVRCLQVLDSAIALKTRKHRRLDPHSVRLAGPLFFYFNEARRHEATRRRHTGKRKETFGSGKVP